MKLNTALVILYDSRKKFLLQHRTSDAEVLPGYWAFFGGGIKERETPVEAVKREIIEELEYDLKEPRFFMEQDFKLDGIEGHMYVYIDAFNGDKSRLRIREGQGSGWYGVSEIGKLKMVDHDRELIKKLDSYLAENES